MFLFAILVLSVLASLVDGQDSRKSFPLHQIKSKASIKSGPAAAHLSLDESKSTPEHVQNVPAVNHGSVIASPVAGDIFYLAPVTIGSQTFNLIIDTGSNFLWVLSSDFASSVLSTYNSSISSTSRLQEGKKWAVCYVARTCVGGDTYTETVTAGGIAVKSQTIGVVRKASSSFEQQNANGREGILGLSFKKPVVGVHPYTSFFDNIKSTLPAPLFTADLKYGNPGSFDFGFIDDSKYTGNITYVPVDKSGGDWQFTVNGFAIANDPLKSVVVNVIADTGTSLVFLPQNIVEAYYAGVSGTVYNRKLASYVFPCGTALPRITFKIGNYNNAFIPAPFIEYAPTGDGTTCVGGIQSSGDSGRNILGDIFLKSQFVVFDAGNEPRLGFAAKPL